MSRYITRDAAGREAAYGWDHALGYFLDIFEPGEDEPVVQETSLFTGMNNGRLLHLLREHGVGVPLEHYEKIVLDRPF